MKSIRSPGSSFKIFMVDIGLSPIFIWNKVRLPNKLFATRYISIDCSTILYFNFENERNETLSLLSILYRQFTVLLSPPIPPNTWMILIPCNGVNMLNKKEKPLQYLFNVLCKKIVFVLPAFNIFGFILFEIRPSFSSETVGISSPTSIYGCGRTDG